MVFETIARMREKNERKKMNKLSKRAISLIVITTFLISMIPIMPASAALGTPSVTDDTVTVGQTINVFGGAGEVTSGATVKVFWDIAIGAGSILLNTTTGNSDGSYSADLDIPDSVNGSHYVWVEDTATAARARSGMVNVSAEADTDISSGLAGDTVEMTGTGYGNEQPVNVSMYFDNAGSWMYNTTLIDYDDSIDSNEYGSWLATFDIPSPANYGTYKFNATDGYNVAEVNFTVGASIVFSVDEGPEGTVVEITGRGYNSSVTLGLGAVTWNGSVIPIVGNTADITSGEFTLEVVVPSWGEGSWTLAVSDGTNQGSEDFEIDGVATIEVSPTYGSPGATVTLNGYNYTQIAGTEITLELEGGAASLGTIETEADGTFETTFISPAVTFGTYDVWAKDTTYGVNGSDPFKVGIIAFIITQYLANPVKASVSQESASLTELIT